MPLRPEDNPAYWPLLLSEELYLLPQELKAQAHRAEVQEQNEQTTTSQPPLAAVPGPSPQASLNTPAPAPPQSELLWGSIDRGILILVEYPDHKLMDRPDGLFLVEVLKALKLDFKEVATLNICRCQSAADWQYVLQLPWQLLISFGVQHQQLPATLDTAAYEPKNWNDRLILPAEPLPLIREDVGRKKKLWNLLRQAIVQ